MADQLQRSEISFRRQGSSGLQWDDKLVAEALQHDRTKQENHHTTATATVTAEDDGETRGGLERSRSTSDRPYRTVKAPSPSTDPPSPRFSGCCGVFGKPISARNPKSNRRRTK
ncbi:MAPK kinase substrate protein At1g80180 [Humulus lupulus]|uniref:MAPK kinase substrate protein At1g80180 n=1 Tax=Humulus lupulus TaxID=3486 RepID=UPI002B4047F5|nr:MAPK kinase substrate protein At1g80180 [Humulus lupulus]